MHVMKMTRRVIPLCIILISFAVKAQQSWNIEDLYHIPQYEWIGDPAAPVRSLIYKGEAFGDLAQTDVFAYYATPGTLSGHPERDKNLPAIVLVHGGRGKAYMEWARLWAERGYAAIAMDLAGNGPDGRRLVNAGPKDDNVAKFNSIEGSLDRQWIYHAVANVIRAHSLIRSFAEVDAARTAITGISWGGFLTCIVSGLDSRFKVSVPVYGCGFIYKPDGVFHKNIHALGPDLEKKWIKQYDPSHFIAKAKIPFLWVSGARDFAYQPTIMAKTYSLVKDHSNFRFISDMLHDQEHGAAPQEIATFINHYLLNTYPLPIIKNVQVSAGGKVKAKIQDAKKISSATLCYTEDTLLPYKDRVWKDLPARVTDKKIAADNLPRTAVMWFLTMRDDKGNTVSSEYIFR